MRANTDRIAGVQLVTDPPRRGTPAPPVTLSDDLVPSGLTAWAGRSADGFHVQGLIDAEGQTYISCALNGAYQTFEVAQADAAEAFIHPFAYGCTLPL